MDMGALLEEHRVAVGIVGFAALGLFLVLFMITMLQFWAGVFRFFTRDHGRD